MIFTKYSFSCPATCSYEIRVDAKNDDEAVAKIIAEGAIHGKRVHPYALIPAYFVPLFIMFHVAALLQSPQNPLPEKKQWGSQ